MIRNILIIVLVVCLCVGGWALWKQYNGSSAFGSGDVKPREVAAEKDRTDAAFTDLDGNQSKPTTTYDTNALPPQGTGGATNQPPADRKAAIATGSGTVITGPTPVPQDQAPYQQTVSQPTVIGGAPSSALPVSDTIAPNPPNGAVFTGTGKYQWYRQGNITWRVNSGNGSACIAFATMEEWQKQIVFSHGCGNA